MITKKIPLAQGLPFFLTLTTAFDLGLVWIRNVHFTGCWRPFPEMDKLLFCDGQTTFFFLVWNLFLAWIPLWLAWAMRRLDTGAPLRLIPVLLLGLWLLFFPNAPYLITDFIHLRARPPVPVWYDLFTLFAFAWTGLLLGFLSLLEVQRFLERWQGPALARGVILLALLSSGFGVYIGRFQRWNSWDLLVRPGMLLQDLRELLSGLPGQWPVMAFIGGFSLFLALGFYTLQSLRRI